MDEEMYEHYLEPKYPKEKEEKIRQVKTQIREKKVSTKKKKIKKLKVKIAKIQLSRAAARLDKFQERLLKEQLKRKKGNILARIEDKIPRTFFVEKETKILNSRSREAKEESKEKRMRFLS